MRLFFVVLTTLCLLGHSTENSTSPSISPDTNLDTGISEDLKESKPQPKRKRRVKKSTGEKKLNPEASPVEDAPPAPPVY